jgi:hypothetical protein
MGRPLIFVAMLAFFATGHYVAGALCAFVLVCRALRES